MRTLMTLALVALMLIPIAGRSQTPLGPQAFEYDRKAPVDVQEAGVTKRGDIEVHDISYASPECRRISWYQRGRGRLRRSFGGIGIGQIQRRGIARSFWTKRWHWRRAAWFRC